MPPSEHLVRHRAQPAFRGGVGEAQLTYQIQSEYAGDPPVSHRLKAHTAHGLLIFTIPPKLRPYPRLGHLTLVLANGSASKSTTDSLRVRSQQQQHPLTV